jgi:hypothetical protein
MSEQHDQQASPGYMGPRGTPDQASGEENEEKSPLQVLKDDITGKADVEAAEEQPGSVPADMDRHERQDVGLATADVQNDPYAGSAGSRALDLAEGDTDR